MRSLGTPRLKWSFAHEHRKTDRYFFAYLQRKKEELPSKFGKENRGFLLLWLLFREERLNLCFRCTFYKVCCSPQHRRGQMAVHKAGWHTTTDRQSGTWCGAPARWTSGCFPLSVHCDRWYLELIDISYRICANLNYLSYLSYKMLGWTMWLVASTHWKRKKEENLFWKNPQIWQHRI